jgi:hypothetical protein
VFVCAGCGLLDISERRDSLTCSTKCRVRAHRNGSLETLRAIARGMHIHPAMIAQAKAIQTLRPDIADQVMAGKLSMTEAQALIWPAFWALVDQQELPA